MKKNNNLRTMKEEETRKTNGGSVAALIIAGLAIAGPFAGVAWDMGQSIGQAIVKRRK